MARKSGSRFWDNWNISLDLSEKARGEIVGLALLVVGALAFLSLLFITRGPLAEGAAELLRRAFGWGAYPLALAVMLGGAWIVIQSARGEPRFPWRAVIGAEIAFLAFLAALHIATPSSNARLLAEAGEGGGYFGWALGGFASDLFGAIVAFAAYALLCLAGVVIALDWGEDDLRGFLAQAEVWLARRPGQIAPPPTPRTEREKPKAVPRPRRRKPEAAPARAKLPRGQRDPRLPALEIFREAKGPAADQAEAEYQARVIEETLASFGLPARVVEVNRGPTVTQYGLEPGYIERKTPDGQIKLAKVKVSRIAALSNDLALALSASPIRIETPVPGRPLVGIEVPNSKTALVSLRGVLESDAFRKVNSKLRLALGQDVAGQAIVADLAVMPHLLIAGATGSGKSVCINTIVASLLCQNTPDELKFLMIDPKMVELVAFNGLPHLLAPVVVELERAVGALQWVMREMDKRYHLFAQAGARNLEVYNRQMHKPGGETLPAIVVIIDELADLMLMAPEEIERTICRLAQMARATGIHLVIATQRPSVDVITGLIKANFPARISFAVTTQVDSRVILDAAGAEKLLGRGDMLYMASDASKLVRLQGCYVSDEELKRLVRHWRDTWAMYVAEGEEGEEVVFEPAVMAREEQVDELFDQAVAVIQQTGRASTSFLQRRLSIGYNRAARLMDMMEARGLVGPSDPKTGYRAVLIGEDGEE